MIDQKKGIYVFMIYILILEITKKPYYWLLLYYSPVHPKQQGLLRNYDTISSTQCSSLSTFWKTEAAKGEYVFN